MDAVKIQIEIPDTVYAKLDQHIAETITRVLNDRVSDIRKQAEKLTRAEAAKKLRISLPTLDIHLSSGVIKSQRVGRRVLIPLSELENFLKHPKGK